MPLVILLVLLHALVPKLVHRSILTDPILLTAPGMAAFALQPAYGELGRSGTDVFLHTAERGLVLLLSSVANRIGLGMPKPVRNLVLRLLTSVLALVYIQQQAYLETNATVIHTVLVTVLLGILAHGLSAGPGVPRYARLVQQLPVGARERAV